MANIEPVSGWALNRIAELDRYYSSLAGSFLRASAERRQVIAAFLSVTNASGPTEARYIAEFLVGTDHRSILLKAFGSVPTGFRGALGRCGAQPFPMSGFYRLLHRTLENDDRVAQMIRRLKKIDPNRLRIARLLPEHALTPSLVSIISTPSMARDVATMLTLLESNGVDRKALADALASLTDVDQFGSFWSRWASKCAFPTHPVPRSARYIPIGNGRDLFAMASRYRNCSRDFLERALRGTCAFGEFVHPLGSVVVHLVRKGDEWILDGLYGPSNRTAPPQVRDAAVRHFRTHGIVDKFGRRTGLDWSALRRLTATSRFDFAFE